MHTIFSLLSHSHYRADIKIYLEFNRVMCSVFSRHRFPCIHPTLAYCSKLSQEISFSPISSEILIQNSRIICKFQEIQRGNPNNCNNETLCILHIFRAEIPFINEKLMSHHTMLPANNVVVCGGGNVSPCWYRGEIFRSREFIIIVFWLSKKPLEREDKHMLQGSLKRRHHSLLVDELLHSSWFQWTVNNNARRPMPYGGKQCLPAYLFCYHLPCRDASQIYAIHGTHSHIISSPLEAPWRCTLTQ
jgi:hypothetical protein